MKPILLLFISLFITITLQAQVSKTIEVSAGNLEYVLTANERKTITNLTVIGIIDDRDFKALNYMPSLTELDLSEVYILPNRSPYGASSAIPTNAFLQQGGGSNDHLKTIKLPLSCRKISSRAFSGCSGLTTVIIPPSVWYIESDAFKDCISLESITIPLSVTFLDVPYIFSNCTSLKTVYASNSTKINFNENDSINIVVLPYLDLSANTVTLRATKEITATINIASDSTWTVSSNKSWLTVNSSSGRGIQELIISANVNTLATKRTALLTFKIDTVIVNSVIVNQFGTTQLINVSAGELNGLSEKELQYLSSISLTGTIDKRDFDTMKNIPWLSEIDLRGVDILAYEYGERLFPANTIPSYAFGFYVSDDLYKYKSVLLPYSCTSIGQNAFDYLHGLTSITISSSVKSIGSYAFSGCRNLTSIIAHSSSPVDQSAPETYNLFGDIDKSICTLYVPYGSKEQYAVADNWKDFYNIVEIPFIEVFKTQLNLAASQGSTAATKIVSDVSWTAISDQTWLTLSQSSGSGEQTLTFMADANPTSNPRTAIVTISADGVESQTITITQEGGTNALPDLAENSKQLKCYPNPFTDEIAIEIQNPKHTEITVDIYNLAGERIKNLATQRKDEKLDLKWNGTNDLGKKVTPGVYICKVNNKSKQLIYQGK